MSKLKQRLVAVYEIMYEIAQKFKWYVKIRTKYRLRIMGPVKTLKYISDNHCSVARYGDGEFGIMIDAHAYTYFQDQTPELSAALKKVFEDQDDRILICLPRYFNTTVGTKKSVKKYWRSWGYKKNYQIKVVNLIRESNKSQVDSCFGDALITRPYIDMKTSKLAKKTFSQLRQLWEQKDILIIEGTLTRLGIGNDLFSNTKSIKRILAPALNAFNYYEEIKKATVDLYNGELVLIALGPTATVLASDFSKMGIWAIDIGHIDIEYEWFLRNASEKIAIPGKYTNEVSEGRTSSDCIDHKYLEEIVIKIGK